MRFHKELYLVILGTFLYYTLVLNERRELEGYKFPVYSTPFCPRNESEWNKRSAALGCNETNGFTCLPNQNFTKLLEFCYTQSRIRIEAGTCLYLVTRVSKVNGHNCHNFTHGCHNASFLSDRIYEYPACISLGNGCFLAEPSCKSDNFPYLHDNGSININEDTTITRIYPQQSTEQIHTENPFMNTKENYTLTAILLGTIIPICVLFVLSSCYVFHKRNLQICKRHGDVESSDVEKGAQSKEQHELNDTDPIDEEPPHFQQKRVFKSHRDEEIETLTQDSQHVDENSQHHEIEMLTPLLAKNENMSCQDLPVRNRNDKESLKVEILAQSFENNQLINTVPMNITAPTKEVSVIYRRKCSLESDDKEKINQSIFDNQHVDGNADNHEVEMLTSPMGKNMNFTYQVCRRKDNQEFHEEEEIKILLVGDEEHLNNDTGCSHDEKECIQSIEIDKDKTNQESHMEMSIFNQWEQDNICFISTNACKEVEKRIKSRNLVIVTGHSGSGKSAIIQHIALQYRKQGWTVRRIKKVKEIVDVYSSSRFQKNKTICVFNDPLGKESVDDILKNSWQTYREDLEIYLKTAKLVMSCRSHIIFDARMLSYLITQSNVVKIDDNKNKLSVKEKMQILNKYTSNLNLSDEDCSKIVEVEKYFPLLCKLYSSKEDNQKKGVEFFTQPVTMLKEEIIEFRKKDTGKYCALALLVLFNDELCVSNLLKNKDTEYKFKHTLKLAGLSENTPPSAIKDNLNTLKDFFVKQVGDTYHFYHDFVMEVTTYVFGTDNPTETIKYADIGFLRRKVELGNPEEHNDSFTVYLNDGHKEELGERLFSELVGERILDVVLNPCLKNETVIEIMKKKIADHPEYLQMLLESKKLTVNKQEFDRTSENLLFSKLSFLSLENEVSPLFALIVFCHTQLSQYCVNTLQQKQICFLISAMCCNGSIDLFFNAFKDHGKETLEKKWGSLCPIHIVSVFHNYKLLNELIKIGVKVNQKTDVNGGWTPLTLAAGNDTQENGDYNNRESGAERRDKTVQLLLSNGADINLCNKNGASPLYIACQIGRDSTVELLLSNGADINLCMEDGVSPLYIACQYRYVSTVQRLLSNGADSNLCKKNGAGPLFIACHNGHDSIVQLLLSNGADINLCKENGASPLFVACENGHDSIVQLLLSIGANINLCMEDGASPLYIACHNGHDNTVQLLLNNGADINLCNKNGASPLFTACQNGHDSTVQPLLSNGADINLCMENGASPLFIACENGHDSTVQLLLSIGANFNLCMEDGESPLFIACQNGHVNTVQLLLSNGANINLYMEDGASPLYIACQNGHDSTVQLLLSNGANINFCKKTGASPLFIACQNGHDSTVQLLLSNGADINLCKKNGTGPLHIACHNGHDSTVQLLLSNGADINLCTKDRVSPLIYAFENRQYELVKILLNTGADTSLACGWEVNPALIDCFDKQDCTVVFLLQKDNISNNMYDPDSYFSLFVSCQVERVDRMTFLEQV